MTIAVSFDQQSAVLNGTVPMKAVPLSLLPNGDTDWGAEPVTRSLPCLGCPLSRDGGQVCRHYVDDNSKTGPTCCGKKQRKDGRAIVWRIA